MPARTACCRCMLPCTRWTSAASGSAPPYLCQLSKGGADALPSCQAALVVVLQRGQAAVNHQAVVLREISRAEASKTSREVKSSRESQPRAVGTPPCCSDAVGTWLCQPVWRWHAACSRDPAHPHTPFARLKRRDALLRRLCRLSRLMQLGRQRLLLLPLRLQLGGQAALVFQLHEEGVGLRVGV